MANSTRGRPRGDGERYPSGDLKPAKLPARETARTPISGALWQRMQADAEKALGDARFGTELGRLGATGQITPSEVAIGFRVAGIYGRFEYYTGLKRSAASPHYIREFIAEGTGEEQDPFARPAQISDHDLARSLLDSREDREREAAAAFKELQAIIPREYRDCLERLCVQNEHVGYQGLISARIGLALVKEHFAAADGANGKSGRKKRMKLQRVSLEPAPQAKPLSLNPFKAAFFKVQRSINPTISEDGLEKAWETLQALKAREDFRRAKLEQAST